MKFVLCALAAMTLSSCATILNDENQNINVTTSTGVDVKGSIAGIPFVGPGVVSVKRSKADKIIMVDSAACSKQTLLASTVDPKFFINILTGGTFGSSTDYATEEMWKFQESVVISCKGTSSSTTQL